MNPLNDRLLVFQFLLGACNRYHYLRRRRLTFLNKLCSGLKYRAHLHLRNLGICNAEPDAAMSEHRIVLPQGFGALIKFAHIYIEVFSKCLELIFVMRHKFMKRRIQ